MSGADAKRDVSRRRFLGLLGATGIGTAVGLAGSEVAHTIADSPDGNADDRTIVPFRGTHQAGIVTDRQRHLLFASLDVVEPSRASLRGLLGYWTDAAARMTRGGSITVPGDSRGVVWDTGEAVDVGPSRLTVTFGVGPTLFVRDGVDRFGLASSRPPALSDLPAFRGDQLDASRTGGDVCIVACADDEQAAFRAVRELVRLGHGLVVVRWSQPGFVPGGREDVTPRNLLGFKDGTNNIHGGDGDALERFVWVGDEGPAWLRGGTFLVVRRINIRINRWDASRLDEQEAVIGRSKACGAPLSGRDEHDPLDLLATDADGAPLIPANAHVRLAAPASNGGQRILRRPYSFVDDAGGEGNLSAGLAFLAYQRDPGKQFVPIQRRLARSDALGNYISHTGSAVFAIFPGVAPGEVFGSGLL
jgi:deferrochelatase/peroxidase EfeB